MSKSRAQAGSANKCEYRAIVSLLALLSIAGTEPAAAQRFEVSDHFVNGAPQAFEKILPILQFAPYIQNRTICSVTVSQRSHLCVTLQNGQEIFLPPLPPLIAPDLQMALPSELWYEGTVWVPTQYVERGGEGIRVWVAALEKGVRFACEGDQCLVVRRLFVRSSSDEILGACRTPVIGSYAGAGGCYPLVLRSGGAIWVRAYLYSNPMGGMGNTHVRIFAPPRTDMTPVTTAILNALSLPPWQMKVQRRRFSVTGVGIRRVSPIASIWRELLSVHIDGWTTEQANNNGQAVALNFELSTLLYVNRQNTTRPDDWQMPPPEIEEAYKSRLLNTLRTAVAGSCRSGRWWDQLTFVCNLPPTFVPESPL
jgi:hypothetical protein